MNRRLVSFFVIVILLTFAFGMSLKFQSVKAEPGTLYIRANGSIDPPTAPISTIDNVTYILTGNITSDADGIVMRETTLLLMGQATPFKEPESIRPTE